MRNGRLPLVLLAAVLALVSAAGCVPELRGVSRTSEEPSLDGTQWKLDFYGMPGKLAAALPTREATIKFNNGALSGQATCNSYFGHYASRPDGTLNITGLGGTKMSCTEPGVMIQEQAFLNALTLAQTYEVVDGKLRISGGGMLLVLERLQGFSLVGTAGADSGGEQMTTRTVTVTLLMLAVLSAIAGCAPQVQPIPKSSTIQPPLADTSWMLDSLGAPDSQHLTLAGSDITLQFTGDTGISGSAGCNAFHGTYESDLNGTLEVSTLLRSQIYCFWPDMLAQEREFLDDLVGAERYEFSGGKLHISGDGMLLVLSPD